MSVDACEKWALNIGHRTPNIELRSEDEDEESPPAVGGIFLSLYRKGAEVAKERKAGTMGF